MVFFSLVTYKNKEVWEDCWANYFYYKNEKELPFTDEAVTLVTELFHVETIQFIEEFAEEIDYDFTAKISDAMIDADWRDCPIIDIYVEFFSDVEDDLYHLSTEEKSFTSAGGIKGHLTDSMYDKQDEVIVKAVALLTNKERKESDGWTQKIEKYYKENSEVIAKYL